MSIDASLLLKAAAAAAGAQQYPAAALYMVATPIGNLADLSLRAIHVLATVDAVACEDTRVSGGLLRHLGLERPLLAVHQHNEREAAAGIVRRLEGGERVAYVSDAGTPALSDPGGVLVAAVQSAGYRVVPIPGASSALAALSVAGDPLGGHGFAFVGFAGTKRKDREPALAEAAAGAATQILFEAPHRIRATLADLARRCPQRRMTVCRELTKQFESVVTLPAAAFPAWLEEDAHRERGEFVLVLHAVEGAGAADADDVAPDRLLAALLGALPLKQAVQLATEATGLPRNRLYARALALRGTGTDDS